MSDYELITQYDSANFTPEVQVPAVFGGARRIRFICIHWWGLPEWNQRFLDIVGFLCDGGRPNRTSAHEVIEAGRVAVIVNHRDAAWAAATADGEANREAIHLEVHPGGSDGTYRTVAERVRDLREQYGDIPLRPHNHWTATMCPGTLDLARIDREARAVQHAASVVAPIAPKPKPTVAYLIPELDIPLP